MGQSETVLFFFVLCCTRKFLSLTNMYCHLPILFSKKHTRQKSVFYFDFCRYVNCGANVYVILPNRRLVVILFPLIFSLYIDHLLQVLFFTFDSMVRGREDFSTKCGFKRSTTETIRICFHFKA